MQLFCADIRGLDESRSMLSGRSLSHGSAFGMSLLAFSVRQVWGEELPEISETEKGKPVFVNRPHWHFSISHSKTHVLCALSDFPIGADVETRREVRPSVVERLSKGSESSGLDFFQLWTLRESLYKLTGEGDLRKIPFSKDGDDIVAPVEGVRCRLYNEIDGCAAALCAFQGEFPDEIIFVKPEQLCSK